MIPEELGFNTDEIVDEVAGKISDFESKHSDKINKVTSAWNLYKGIPVERRARETDGLANTYVYETPRIVDTLATTQYRMIMSQTPPFEITSQRGDVPEDVLFRLTALKRKQFEWIQYPKNLFRTLKSCNLMGTAIVEHPWLQGEIVNGYPVWEAAGFIPRPLNQIFFAPNAMDIEKADYSGTLDIVTNYRLHTILNSYPGQTEWIAQGIQDAINEDTESVPAQVRQRLTSVGYYDFTGNKELAAYYGPLESQNSYEDWVVGLVNRKHLVRLHKPAVPGRPLSVIYASYIEQEAFGYGVKDSELLQKMLNSNRNRLFDLITFALYSMFKVDRFAGLDVREARIKPWNFIFMDNIAGMEPLRPMLEAAPWGIKLEELLKEEFQARTGATKNLQSIETDVTATEVNILMDQAMRKIGVDTELMAEPLMRQFLYYGQKLDRLFLDQPIWLSTTGMNGPVAVTPDDIAHEVDYSNRISTDKDFRPNRLRRLIEFIQILTSVRNDLQQPVNVLPFIEQGARMLDMDPRFLRMPPPQVPNLADLTMQAFNRQQSRLDLLNKERGMFGQPAPLQGSPETPLPMFR